MNAHRSTVSAHSRFVNLKEKGSWIHNATKQETTLPTYLHRHRHPMIPS